MFFLHIVFIVFEVNPSTFFPREDHPTNGPKLVFQEPVPKVIMSSAPFQEDPLTPVLGSKRSLPDDADLKEQPALKKTKTSNNGIINATPTQSPSKGYKEVDGVIVIEDEPDDIIVLDD